MDDVRMDMSALVGAVFARWIRILFVTIGLLVITYVVLSFMPKLYESSASILVEVRDNAYTRATNDVLPQAGFSDEIAIASQIELVKSRGTLMQVIDELNLRSVAEFNGSQTGPLDIIFRLMGSSSEPRQIDEIVLEYVSEATTVVRERESRVITVQVRSIDAELSAQIANAIANAHVQRRAGLYLSDTADASQWLETEIAKLRVRVNDAADKVANYRVDNDLFVGANDTTLLDQQLSDLSTQISAAQERENSARSRALLIREMVRSGQSIDGLPDVRNSLAVQQLAEEKARLQGEKAQQSATLLPNHPTVLALTAQISEIDAQMQIEARQVANSLEAEAKIEAGLEQSLRDELIRLKLEASSATKGSVELNELEREATAQRDLLETYLLRYRDAASRTESQATLPDVRVVSLAAAPLNPAYPQTGLILAAVAVVSLMFQIGQILFAELIAGRAFVDAQGRSVRDRYDAEPADAGANNIQPTPARQPEPMRQPAPQPAAEEVRKPVQQTIPASPESEYSEPEHVEPRRAPVAAPPPRNAKPRRAAPPPRAASEKTTDRRAPGTRYVFDKDLSQVSAKLAAGTDRLVIIASIGRVNDAHGATEALTADLVARGVSTVEIDAGSRKTTPELGLSDLCSDLAGFGDVVHRGARSDFALVPWGQQADIDFRTDKCMTLIDALQDIFEIVVLDAGRVGIASCLNQFTRTNARIVLVGSERTDSVQIDHIQEDLRAIGYRNIETAIVRQDRSRAA